MSANAAARSAEPRTERPERPPVVLALVGPTGSGKTAVSLAVAPGLRAEIVGVDSMQVYRGMDVGTAKPTPEERRRVPHHMIDIADPGKPSSVASFQTAARAATDAILARGRTPLLVGGSGLYYRALVDDLEFPPTDPAVRQAIGARDPDVLVERLRSRDPDAADRIDPANLRRVVRALEVMELTSKRFSDFRTAWDRYESRYDLVAAGLRVPADKLEDRIKARVDRMLEQGLVDEVRGLLERGFRSALTAPRAIAYPETVAHLDGSMTLDEACEQIVRNTRRYARRQNSWFKADPRIRWFDASDTERATGEIRAYYEHEIARRTVGA
ncbi:MAG: tRNA (adenosine(37)-N6)-dimethylallyltransferase MiaA [Actinomycetota bacterium]